MVFLRKKTLECVNERSNIESAVDGGMSQFNSLLY